MLSKREQYLYHPQKPEWNMYMYSLWYKGTQENVQGHHVFSDTCICYSIKLHKYIPGHEVIGARRIHIFIYNIKLQNLYIAMVTLKLELQIDLYVYIQLRLEDTLAQSEIQELVMWTCESLWRYMYVLQYVCQRGSRGIWYAYHDTLSCMSDIAGSQVLKINRQQRNTAANIPVIKKF